MNRDCVTTFGSNRCSVTMNGFLRIMNRNSLWPTCAIGQSYLSCCLKNTSSKLIKLCISGQRVFSPLSPHPFVYNLTREKQQSSTIIIISDIFKLFSSAIQSIIFQVPFPTSNPITFTANGNGNNVLTAGTDVHVE